MASPSSSSFIPSQGWRYEVFLSFRGEDTRNTFVDHLFGALHQRGLCVFKDDVMLRRGEEISRELLKSIEESMLAVVVFSERYANSSWCLAELAKIMECHNQMGLKVLPVFYHVDPSDVRSQKNNFEIAFQQHEKKFREEMDKVNKWRKALTSAASLSGYHISENINEGEYTFINKIVQEVLGGIRPCNVDSNLIDIESRLRALISLLGGEEASQDVRMVGIHGMGGIGKTTIARALFKRIAHKFEGSSFVYDVRENTTTKIGICHLQEKVLREILKTDHNFNIQHPEDGADMIRARLCRKRVLLVLDDVDHHSHLEFLANSGEWFGPGSRILITTRDKRMLSDTYAKYKPDLLKVDQALELFCRHAFKKLTPLQGYEELSCRAIHYAGYLPLAVKVLGSFFRGRDASVWKSAFNRFAKEPNKDISGILKISFDGLTDLEKKVFLDIACFFKGEHVYRVARVLDSFGFEPDIGISVLVEKSLITVSEYGRIDMHDLIQEMGRQIVRKSFPNSRIWQPEQINDIIKRNEKLEEIEAIVMSDYRYDVDRYEENVCFSAHVIERMKNLRMLDIIGGTIEQFWNGQQMMKNMKYMKLQELDCLTMFPDVSNAPNIETLSLLYCNNLVKVHESLGSHKRLIKLEISRCERLKHFPSTIEMDCLERLSLNNCPCLERFPYVSPHMEQLSCVIAGSYSNTEESPISVHVQLNLKNSENSFCNCKIPLEPQKLRSIKDMKILTNVFDFKSLNSLTNVCSLKILHLEGRQMEDEDFPKDLHSLSSLESLNLSGNNKLIQLPASISHLSSLKGLFLNSCNQLQNLDGIPSNIWWLNADYCSSLENIKALSTRCGRLHRATFARCEKLLEDQETERCVRKIFESFLKRCDADAGDYHLYLVFPGKMIPRWFQEEADGCCNVALKIPSKNKNQIIGIAMCAVFALPLFIDKSEKEGELFGNKEFTRINAYAPPENGNAVSIHCARIQKYLPFVVQDGASSTPYIAPSISHWYHIDHNHSIDVTIPAVKCGARLVYKEDVELSVTSRI